MKAALEAAVYVAALLVLGVLVIQEGRVRVELEAATDVAPRDLYRMMSGAGAKLQLVDVRGDMPGNYEDSRVPGSIPFPGCDDSATPPAALERIIASVPTIIISGDGDRATFEKCRARFAQARNLKGGVEAWVDGNLPEDSGEYVPPKSGAGGGCL